MALSDYSCVIIIIIIVRTSRVTTYPQLYEYIRAYYSDRYPDTNNGCPRYEACRVRCRTRY
jgi:hypothetical protein